MGNTYFINLDLRQPNMARTLLILSTLLTIISCRESNSLNENEKVIIIGEVRQTLDNYYNDIRKSGLLAEFKYLDSFSDFFWVPPGYSSSISFDSVSKVLKQNAPLFKSIDNSFDTLRIIPLTKSIASYTGLLKSTMTNTSGKAIIYSLVETGVLVKRQDGWKLLNGQTTLLNQKE